VTGYTVTSTPGGITKTVDAGNTSTTLAGLTNSTGYTFKVTATNTVGDSTPSDASSSVTPAAPATVPTPGPPPSSPTITGVTVAVTGAPVENGVLRADVTTAGTPTGLRLQYQWLLNGHPIRQRGRNVALLILPDEVGKQLSVRVTADAPGYDSLQLTSDHTRSIRSAVYLNVNRTTTASGEPIRLYGRGPAQVTAYRVSATHGVLAQPVDGQTDDTGLFHRAIVLPDDVHGEVTLTVTMRDDRGRVVYRRHITVQVTHH
jgi:hypothetical protein